MRLVRKPTSTAETANRKKKDEPIRPNCSGFKPSSAMIGWAARPTTTLSAKLISMNRNRSPVIGQAPFKGRSAVVMRRFSLSPFAGVVRPLRQVQSAGRKAGKRKGALLAERPFRFSDARLLDERALAVLERTVGLV